jgi:hypothetical protein
VWVLLLLWSSGTSGHGTAEVLLLLWSSGTSGHGTAEVLLLLWSSGTSGRMACGSVSGGGLLMQGTAYIHGPVIVSSHMALLPLQVFSLSYATSTRCLCR